MPHPPCSMLELQTTNVVLLLLQMQEDSIDGIYDTLKQTAKISQSAGGRGLSIHNVRATGLTSRQRTSNEQPHAKSV